MNKKYLFIDMDGVLATFASPENKCIIPDFNKKGLFISKKPVKDIINAIYNVFPEKDYEYFIITAYPNDISIKEKNQWLDIYFNVKKENRIFVKWKVENKADSLRQYSKVNNLNINNFIIIDDEVNNLFKCEEVGIRAIHPSYLLFLNEQKNRLKINPNKFKPTR